MHSESIPAEIAAMAQPHRGIIQRAFAVWDGVVCDFFRKAAAEEHEVDITPPVHTLFLTRTSDPRPVIKRARGEKDLKIIHPGILVNFVAAGDTLHTIAPHGQAQLDRFAFALTPQVLERLQPGFGENRLELTTAVNIQNASERQLATALAFEIEHPGLHSRLYAESLTTALTIELIRNHGIEAGTTCDIRGGLAPWQVRRVIEYLRANLADDVSLKELSALLGLSSAHFSRAFRKVTGLPPHRYQLSVRVERAKDLLLKSDLSLDAIASSCGFGDSGHFSKVFRRFAGVSPGAWRRDRRW